MTIKRLPIYQYSSSRKCIALDTHSNIEGYKSIAINEDLCAIEEVSDIQNIRKKEVHLLEIKLEVAVTEKRIGKEQLKAGYQFIRIINPGDLDIDKWLSTERLEDLPVAPHPEINAEELRWAGESPGNLQGRVILYGLISILLFYVAFNQDPLRLSLVATAVLIIIYIIKKTKWSSPTKASESKINELKKYKQALIERQ